MTETLTQYWPLILGGILIALGLIWFLTRRRQRVDIGSADPVIAATLARTPAPEPVIVGPDPLAGAVALAVSASNGPADDLRRIKGLGPKVAARLGELGVTRYDQLAALDGAEQAALDAQLGAFAGRMARDRWVEQAAFLARNDLAGFETEFGKLG